MKKLISRTEAGAEKTYNVRKGLKKRLRSTGATKTRKISVKSERNKLTAALEAFETQVQRDRTARLASNRNTTTSMSTTDTKASTIGRSASKVIQVKSNKNKQGRRSCAPEMKETREAEEDAFQTAVRGSTNLFAAAYAALDNKSENHTCLLYTSPSPRDISGSRMPSSA